MKKRMYYERHPEVTDENYVRINNILSADKLPMDPECRKVALQDIKNTLSEYFELENLRMEIKENGRGFSVSITFNALRVKSFNLLK